jgi:hypothetical protein
MNKFHARKVTLDGIDFASQAEANRYAELKLLERAREIKALSCHPRYPLTINGVTIGVYTSDFAYFEGGRKIVEDVKGKMTPDASLRLRVFRALYPDIELRIHHKGQSRTLKQRAVAA